MLDLSFSVTFSTEGASQASLEAASALGRESEMSLEYLVPRNKEVLKNEGAPTGPIWDEI